MKDYREMNPEEKAEMKRIRLERKKIRRRIQIGSAALLMLAGGLVGEALRAGKEVVTGTELLKQKVYEEVVDAAPFYWMDYSSGLKFFENNTGEEIPYDVVCSSYRKLAEQLGLSDAELSIGLAVLPYSVENDVMDFNVSLGEKCEAARNYARREAAYEELEKQGLGR